MSPKKIVDDGVGLKDTIEIVLNKKRGNAHFEIKHDGDGVESWTITSKDEQGKEVKIVLPWEAIQQLRKQSDKLNKK